MQYHKLEGIIINRHTVGDADRYYTILTSDAGKISVFARGVRSVKSKRASSLDLFSHIKFELADKGRTKTLTHVELVNSFSSGKKELKNISRLFQMGELIDALVPEDDPQEIIYRLLLTALTHLTRFDTPEYLMRFKVRLLRELGFENRELGNAEIDDYIESLLSRPLRAKDMV
jgi:DNA repair protein RecO